MSRRSLRFNEAEKLAIVKEGEKTGVRAVCVKYGISDQSFRLWRYKVRGIQPKKFYSLEKKHGILEEGFQNGNEWFCAAYRIDLTIYYKRLYDSLAQRLVAKRLREKLTAFQRRVARFSQRATAPAETIWTPAAAKDYVDFVARLRMHRAKLDAMKILYHPFENEPAVFGEWKPDEIGESFVRREWDLTPYLTRAGTCEVTFQYSSGKHRLDIAKAELLENGSPISSDRHDGTTGWHDSGNQYRFSLDVLHPASKYLLRATVPTDGGADSTGEVLVKVVPSNPTFTK